MNRILLLALAIFCFVSSTAQKNLKREVRGAWVTTYLGLDWPSRLDAQATQRTKLVNILEQHRQTGINTIYFQVRSQSDAMYPSTIEPWSYDLTGQQGTGPAPTWDPLQFALNESRKRGMEFHAWINPFRAIATNSDTINTAKFTSQHIYKKHPEWMLPIGSGTIINPGIPAARDYIVSVIVDIVNRYDVDGIHFDDYFYTSSVVNDLNAYLADPRGFPNTTAGRADWRRDNINLFIKAVNDTISALKPWVKFGVSPSGIYRSSTNPAIGSPTSTGAHQHYSASFADSKKWLQEGWVDYIAPQVYWHIGQTGSDYAVLIPWWNNNAFGRHIYIGMANYKINDASQGAPWTQRSHFPNQVRMNRNSLYPNVHGGIFFRTVHLGTNALNHRDSLRTRFYTLPALQPSMFWKDSEAPDAPTELTAVKYGNDSVVLRWTKPAATANELQRANRFVVYRSTSPVIDTEDQANIQAITINDTTGYRDTKITANTTYYYVVTSLDRLHNESSASNMADNLPPVITCPADVTLSTNGSCNVTVPDYRSQTTVDGIANNAVVTITQSPAPGTVVNGTGKTSITLTATDKANQSGSCSFNLTRTDETPPVISNASADPSVIWAPNHKMKLINVNYTATDNCGPVTTTLTVSSNEPETGLGSGDTGPDFEVVSNTKVKVRAERSGSGTGRIYTITITATDASGNTSTQNVIVSVPHDRSDITTTRTTPASAANAEKNILSVYAAPNPAAGPFTVTINSGSAEKISLRVMNIDGRVIEKKANVAPNSTLSLGANYLPGNYYIEVVQGKQSRVVKVVKGS